MNPLDPLSLSSLSDVRAKVYGHALDAVQFKRIIQDIVDDRYSPLHIASFVTACAGDRLNTQEICYLTEAMIDVGTKITWHQTPVLDKHCIGGLPGNRVTPIVVSIVAACGYLIPKTSSRAITSPAGTADTMEVFTNVQLDLPLMKKVIEKEGGCVIWGGSVCLSPADDRIIQVERCLDLDSEGQLVASMLSKKVAVGSTHVLIDIPVGPTAKVRSVESAQRLKSYFLVVGKHLGLCMEVCLSEGEQPIGFGVGPSLEAEDVLAVLTQKSEAPIDLKEKAIRIAGKMLAFANGHPAQQADYLARKTLESGKAYEKFKAICIAQGDFRIPPRARKSLTIETKETGFINSIDNRRLARLAKYLGAPSMKTAGLKLHHKLHDHLQKDEPLLTLYSDSQEKLDEAFNYYQHETDMFVLREQR